MSIAAALPFLSMGGSILGAGSSVLGAGSSVLGAGSSVLGAGSSVLGAGSSVIGGLGQAAEMRQQAKLASYNQGVAQENAQAVRVQGDWKAQQMRIKQRRLQGQAKASRGASGVTASGSPLEVMQENTRLMGEDLLNQQYGTEVAAQGYQNQAQLYGAEAANERSMAGVATTAGILKGATTLITGGAHFGEDYLNSRPTFDDPSHGWGGGAEPSDIDFGWGVNP